MTATYSPSGRSHKLGPTYRKVTAALLLDDTRDKSEDRPFSQHDGFTRIMRSMSGVSGYLTVAELKYIIAKAHEELKTQRNEHGFISNKAIQNNKYGALLSFILKSFCCTYGKAYVISYFLNRSGNMQLRLKLEDIASDYVMRMLDPQPTRKGMVGSIVQLVIDRQYGPGQIVGFIKNSTVEFASRSMRSMHAYGVNKNDLCMLSIDPCDGEFSPITQRADGGERSFDPQHNHLDGLLSSAMDTLTDLERYAMQLYVSELGETLIAEKRTFVAQIQALADLLEVSPHEAKRIAKSILEKFRVCLGIVNFDASRVETRYKDRATRERVARGEQIPSPKTARETVEVEYTAFDSPYVDESDLEDVYRDLYRGKLPLEQMIFSLV